MLAPGLARRKKAELASCRTLAAVIGSEATMAAVSWTSRLSLAMLACSRERAPRHAPLDDRHEPLRVTGLAEILVRYRDQAQHLIALRVAGEDDAHDIRPSLAHCLQELCTIHARHAHVGHDDVDGRPIELRDRLGGALHEDHLPAAALPIQAGAQALEYRRVVVSKEDPCHAARDAFGCVADARPFTGSLMVKRVPTPTVLRASRLPPCFSATMERTMASP